MLKKTMLLAAAVAALAALVAPAAHAKDAKKFTDAGAVLTGSANIVATGTSAFTSSAGGVSCETNGAATLNANSSTGTITAFAPVATNKCSYSGGLDALCGDVDFHSSTGLPWVIHATKTEAGAYQIRVTGVHVDVGGTGIFCPDVTVSGEALLSPDNHTAVNTLTLNGTLSSNLGTSVTATGSSNVIPKGTYGSET